MTVLTPQQIAQHALAAGFRGDAAVKAVAVALAESGGRTDATNVNSDKTRSVDRGLWQINSRWHPEVSAAQAFNPATAARHAYRISNGGKSWTPWSAWKNGSALTQLGKAKLAVAAASKGSPAAPPAGPAGAAPGGVAQVGWWDDFGEGFLRGFPGGGLLDPGHPDGKVNPVEGVKDSIDAMKQALTLAVKVGKWVGDSHNWVRIAFVVGGSAAIVIGASHLAGVGMSPGQVVNVASNALPVGRVAKAAGGAAKAAKAGKAAGTASAATTASSATS